MSAAKKKAKMAPKTAPTRESISLGFTRVADHLEALEAACDEAVESGALEAHEVRRALLAIDWCWTQMVDARPRLKGGAL